MSSLHRLTLVTSQGIVNHGLSPSNQPTHQNTTSSLSTNNNSTNSLDKCDNSHHYSDKPPQYNEVVTEVPPKIVPSIGVEGMGVAALVDDWPPQYSVSDPLNVEDGQGRNAGPQEHPFQGGREQDEDDNDADLWGSTRDSGHEQSIKFNELDTCGKVTRVLQISIKLICIHFFLYVFIISLNLLSQAFRLLGGKTAGGVMANHELLKNPLTGLMIGILATVLMQSSSTSTSIIVTMVAANMIDVAPAIPIIMGANIGTSVTNTVVSMAQYGNRNEFRRSFGAATVHDMFNWLSVIIMLPLEVCTGFLFKISDLMVSDFSLSHYKAKNLDMLKVITKPITKMIVQLDKKVIEGIAAGKTEWNDKRILKIWCKYKVTTVLQNVTQERNFSAVINGTVVTSLQNVTRLENISVETNSEKCYCLLSYIAWSDTISGAILLFVSLFLLVICLMGMVRLLHSMLRGPVASALKKTINSDIPKPFSFLTGYVAIIIGAGLTMILQSSSIFTSTLTPLVGMGVIHIERMYPLTLGSNIGTTATGLLAAMATSGNRFRAALQIGLCHFLFNVGGILLFYPIPFMRKIPINLAKKLGNTTAKYRWFAILYLVTAFFFLPAFVFTLSLAGAEAMIAAGVILLPFITFIIIVNFLQKKYNKLLPKVLKNWDFLPLWLHSLEPLDKFITKCTGICKSCQKKLDRSVPSPVVLTPFAIQGDISPLSSRQSENGSPVSSRSTSLLIQRTTTL